MRHCVIATVLTLFALTSVAQSDGAITGHVFDDKGNPVSKAKVHIAELNQQQTSRRALRIYETASDGKFLIQDVPWGSYVVLAGKEEEGYPDPKFAFYSNLQAPTVTLTPSFPKASVNIALGPKAGKLDVIEVVDAVTRKKLKTASITLRRVSNPNFFIRTSTTVEEILIPSSTRVTVEIEAPGYRAWPEQSQTEEIEVKPGEVFKLDVELHPNQSPSTSPKGRDNVTH
jgi:hypothetical protein